MLGARAYTQFRVPILEVLPVQKRRKTIFSPFLSTVIKHKATIFE
jgi:hypothetical protein